MRKEEFKNMLKEQRLLLHANQHPGGAGTLSLKTIVQIWCTEKLNYFLNFASIFVF